MIYRRAGWLFLMLALFALSSGVVDAASGFGDDDLAEARAAMQRQAWDTATGLLNEVIEREPDNLEARYLRGICYAERGKHRTAESILRDFLGKGETDFTFVLERDSLYRDVLYQYARLRHYAGDFPEAIRLGHVQLRLKPELAHVQVGLFKFYWRFLVETYPEKARRWLREQENDYATYFVGETYWRQGLFRGADKVFAGLLARPRTLSKTAILLGRARAHYAEKKPAAAQAFVEQAIAAITSEADALFLFDDVKYIVSPQEWDEYNRIGDPAGWTRFFEAFWARRDPMPAAPVNVRMSEHYRRLRVAETYYLFYGYRAWYNSPYTSVELQDVPTYALSSDFDDRGVIFIRHGEPDDYTTKGPTAGSWLYEDPLLIFHFAPTCVAGICGHTLHFSPEPVASSWGGRLVGLDPLDMERKSHAYLTQGLATDRHRWADDTELIDLPYMMAAFRGEYGRTLVEIYYALPVGTLSRALDKDADTVAVEVGATLHDLAWRRVQIVRETKRLALSHDRDALVFDRFRMDVPPDSYHVAVHGRSLQTPLLGTDQFGYRVPDFRGPGLQVSDLLLADHIIELETPELLTRDDLYVQVNPLGRFSVEQPVFVYFEIYNLALTPEGRTRYGLTYTLTPQKRGGLRGLLKAGDEGAISLTTQEHEGAAASPIEYVEIDVSDVAPGAYVLTVTVEDKQTGAVVERTRPLDLDKR